MSSTLIEPSSKRQGSENSSRLPGPFSITDPVGLKGGDTNVYRYCGNSPTNATDPTGLLTRTQVGDAKLGDNGLYVVNWKFQLSKEGGYDYPIVLVQKITFTQTVNGTKKTAEYYEVIGFILPHETTICGKEQRGYTEAIKAIRETRRETGNWVVPKAVNTNDANFDDQWTHPKESFNSSGTVTVTGEIKAFKLTDELFEKVLSNWKPFTAHKPPTGQAINIAAITPGALFGVRTDAEALPGVLKFTNKYWNKAGVAIESESGTTTRTFSWTNSGKVKME